MKKFKGFMGIMLLMIMAMAFAGCQKVDNGAAKEGKEASTTAEAGQKAKFETLKDGEEYHIGIVTGTVSQAEDEFRAAEKAIELYGSADNGGIIKHDTYPDRFEAEQETTISKIVDISFELENDTPMHRRNASSICGNHTRLHGLYC